MLAVVLGLEDVGHACFPQESLQQLLGTFGGGCMSITP